MTFCEIAMTYLQVNQTWTVFSLLTNTTDIIEYFPVKNLFSISGDGQRPEESLSRDPKTDSAEDPQIHQHS